MPGRRRTLVFVGVAVLHFFVSLFVFAASFALTMRAFDAGSSYGFGERAVNFVSSVLLFPAAPLASVLPQSVTGGAFGWLLYVANSLLWSLVICCLLFGVSGRFGFGGNREDRGTQGRDARLRG